MDGGQTGQFSVRLGRNVSERNAERSGTGPANRCPAYEQGRLTSRGDEEYDQFHVQPYVMSASYADASRSEILDDPARIEVAIGIVHQTLHGLAGGSAFLEAGFAVRFHSRGTQIVAGGEEM